MTTRRVGAIDHNVLSAFLGVLDEVVDAAGQVGKLEHVLLTAEVPTQDGDIEVVAEFHGTRWTVSFNGKEGGERDG